MEKMRKMKPSGVEWIGDIPQEWEVQRIKNLFSLRDERNFKPLSDVNLISLYTDLGVVQRNEIESPTGNKASNADGYKLVYENDIVVNIILCWMGAIGRSNYNGVTSPAYDIYTPLKETNSYYYHYYFRTTGFSGDCYKRGKGIMAMRWRTYSDDFRDIRVLYPPLTEQQRIAEFLDRKCAEIDSIISKTKATIEQYKALKQSVITQAVTKGIRPDRPMKDSGIEWIGDIPQEWAIVKMKHLGRCRNGLTYSPENVVDEEIGTLVLRSSNIKDGKLMFSDNVFVNNDIREELMVKQGDILICSRNGSRSLIGKNAIIPKNLVATFGAFMMIFRCDKPEYVRYILSSQIFSYYLGTFLTSTINQLTADNFNNMQVVYCQDEREQVEIITYLDHKCAEIDRLIAAKEQLLTELESYKKSVIYEYVTGKKDV